jgi:hypothetical protein
VLVFSAGSNDTPGPVPPDPVPQSLSCTAVFESAPSSVTTLSLIEYAPPRAENIGSPSCWSSVAFQVPLDVQFPGVSVIVPRPGPVGAVRLI